MTTQIQLLQRIADNTAGAGEGSTNPNYSVVDYSGVIILGGVSQTVTNLDPDRIKLTIQAHKTNTEDIWINLNDAASNTIGSISLSSGDLITLETVEAASAINVFSLTPGQGFTAKGVTIEPPS